MMSLLGNSSYHWWDGRSCVSVCCGPFVLGDFHAYKKKAVFPFIKTFHIHRKNWDILLLIPASKNDNDIFLEKMVHVFPTLVDGPCCDVMFSEGLCLISFSFIASANCVWLLAPSWCLLHHLDALEQSVWNFD